MLKRYYSNIPAIRLVEEYVIGFLCFFAKVKYFSTKLFLYLS